MASVCRLCLSSSASHYEPIAAIEDKCFQLVLPEIDIHIVQSPMFCQSCIDLLQTTYSFKSNCIETEKIIKLYASNSLVGKVVLNNILQKHPEIALKKDIKTEYDEDSNKNDLDLAGDDLQNHPETDIKLGDINFDVSLSSVNAREENFDSDDAVILNKPFPCKLCDKSYNHKKDLQEHLRTHFSKSHCKICRKQFYNASTVKRHLRTIHRTKLDLGGNIKSEIDETALEQALKDHGLLEKTGNTENQEHCLAESLEENVSNSNDDSLQDLKDYNIPESIESDEDMVVDSLNKIKDSALQTGSNDNEEDINKTFKCNICERDYHHKKYLLEHIRTHFSKSYCKPCGKQFYNASTVKRHLRTVHRTNLTDLSSNVKVVLDEPALEEALKQHKIEGRIDNELSELNKNIKGEHVSDRDDIQVESFTCNICAGGDYHQKRGLVEHIRTHFTKAHCKVCLKQYCNASTLRRHLQNAHEINVTDKVSWRCHSTLEIDEQGLEQAFREHNLLDGGENKYGSNKDSSSELSKPSSELSKYTCKLCATQFGSKWSFSRHKLPEHSTKKLQCDYCQKVFLTNHKLTRHMSACQLGIRRRKRTHNFICDTCGYATDSKHVLAEHVNTHTGERPYKCEECGKAFAQSSTLRTHKQMMHSNERLFTCEYCSKSFTTNGGLTKHILGVHLGDQVEKKFVCNFCGKKYRVQSQLKRHLMWHKPDRPFSCDLCEKTFVSKHSVKKHRVIHFPEKPHKCEICGKGFHHKYNIKIHMKVHGTVL